MLVASAYVCFKEGHNVLHLHVWINLKYVGLAYVRHERDLHETLIGRCSLGTRFICSGTRAATDRYLPQVDLSYMVHSAEDASSL
jgi:hypothetical protein